MARKYILNNNTHYSKANLRAFVMRVANQVLDANQLPYLHVTFDYNRQVNRGGSCSGRAHIGSPRSRVGNIRIMLPSNYVDKVDFALVIAHEIGHAIGMEHTLKQNDYRGNSIFDRYGNYRDRYAWADSLPLEIAKPKAKVRLTGEDLASKRLAEAQAKLKRWQTKLKRAQTGIKTWKAKVQYYERRLGVLAATNPNGDQNDGHD